MPQPPVPCWPVLWHLQHLLELTPKKRCPFHDRGLEWKMRKSRDTWSNRQIWPWSMEWSRAKANRVLPRERTGHSKHPLPTTQEKILHMDITRWSTPKSDRLYSSQPKMEKTYTVSKNKTGTNCGSDHELLITKFRLTLKKVGKTTRPLWPKSNPLRVYSGVTNRFKGLVLVDRVPKELWTEGFNTAQEAVTKTIPKKKKCNRAKWLSEEALQIVTKEEKQKAKEKRKDTPVWAQSSRE